MPGKRIAVNTRLLQKDKLEGIGWFTYEVCSRMVRQHPNDEFIFLFDRPFHEEFRFAENVKMVKLGPPARHPLLYRIWFNSSIPYLLKKHKADIFVSPDGYLSLRSTVPQIAVMHDLNFEHFPEDLPKVHRDYYRTFFPRFAKKANRIVTVSEYSKKDIHEQYKVPLGLIDVAYNGVGSDFRVDHPEEPFCDGKPYFLSVGSLQPRKNVARLLAAFDKACNRVQQEIQLLVVGESFYWDEKMKAAMDAMQHRNRIHFAGRMDRKGLSQAYSGAVALAYVSYFEGFGIPLVEAMKCECPILTADATCLPEVAGDAAVYCDPFDTNSISDALVRLTENETLRNELRKKGIDRVQEFSWDKTAEQVYSSICTVLDGKA